MGKNQDLIIAIQSSGDALSVCLLQDNESPVLLCGDPSLRQSETLAPMLAQLGVSDWSRVRLIAAGVGPGSFTGIRLGLAAAQGLGMARDIPVHGVSNFDLVRWVTGRENVAVRYNNDTFF
ncbi:MAG: tRNA (adenosine(37)-N6)-threonylcarbamoyltransferase complex dimerization subunit type 1 TsaB, partial [Alphaproteobacteria bacterium]|nr:tRNA (adenosine(37)-N6)-threonylcarbamoyltransferase complex dimerization subunit type 1 TsaB [Alphaproteobacteria bacterium]